MSTRNIYRDPEEEFRKKVSEIGTTELIILLFGVIKKIQEDGTDIGIEGNIMLQQIEEIKNRYA